MGFAGHQQLFIMGYLNVTNIQFLSGNGAVSAPFMLEIKFDCLKDIKNQIEWRFVYVADPDDTSKDQTLDEIVMDGIEYGPSSFEWEIPAPDYTNLAVESSVLDTTVIMVIVLIEGREFFRCSYFLTNEYPDQETYEEAGEKILWDKLVRRINTTHPVITLKDIAWDQLGGNSKEDEHKISNQNGRRFEGLDLLGQ